MEYSSALSRLPEKIWRGFMLFSSYVVVRYFSGEFALWIHKLTFFEEKKVMVMLFSVSFIKH